MSTNSIKNDENSLQRSKKELIGRLGHYLKDYKLDTFISIILIIVVMLCNVVSPYLLKIAIDDYVGDKNLNGLLTIGAILVSLNIFSWIVSRARWRVISRVTNNVLVNIRSELYQHIQKLSFSFFDNRPVGKILARVVGDVNALKNLFDQAIQSLIPESLSLVCVAVIMLFMNVKLALATIALLPFLFISMFYIEIKARKYWEVYRKKKSNLNAFVHEDFSGIKIVQSFTKEKRRAETFSEMVEEVVQSFLKSVRLNDAFWPLVELSWGIGTVVVFYVGYKLIISGEIQVGTLIAFAMYVGMFWRPIMNLSNFYNTLITNLSAADRIFDILEIEPDIVDVDKVEHMPKIKGDVKFDNISFAYDENKDVLKEVTFNVEAGMKIALVGATGSGKTTIVSLLSRFYDPSAGRVLVDDKDIRDVSLESYRSQMGIMLQDTFLFSTSVMENIRYGKLDATDDEVMAAAKAVNAHDFIMNLENGYNTEVNERGARLSLGQRQLVSLARAMLANPRILILDEATSNIDTVTERLVQRGIEKLLEGRTSFVIAHRLSTIRDCDKILVIDNGEISEMGSHAELLNLKGKYFDLYEAQFRFLESGA